MLILYTMLPDGTVHQEPDILTWAEWMETHQTCVQDDRFEGVQVSTVFLGIALHGQHFETMVFGGKADLYRQLYTTHAEAVIGHNVIVTQLKGGQHAQLKSNARWKK